MRGSRPIVVTMGDPAGIGPEVVAKAVARVGGTGLVVVGDASLLQRTARKLGLPRATVDVRHLDAARCDGGVGFVAIAHELTAAGVARAMVTAPIRKLRPWKRGGPAPGHTELLSEWTGTSPAATLLMVSPRLNVALVTNHLPLSRVASSVTQEAVGLAIRRTNEALRHWFGVRRPRIGVLGLNPHAGEGGKIGVEEREVIAPAIARAKRAGIFAEGPLPADSAFAQRKGFRLARPSASLRLRPTESRWHAYVAMYHDQGLIPAKLGGPGSAVNVSLGLPYVRTSVDHGTAYDIAGRGVADPAALIAAIRLAQRLARG